MGVTDTKNKQYKRALAISKKILDTRTLLFASGLRVKSGIEADGLAWLNKERPEQKKLIILTLLKGKSIKSNFLRFWKQLALTHFEYSYLLNSDSAILFVAEIFFTGKISKNTLQETNLTGVEWFEHKLHENDNCLYLKISPSVTTESLTDFLSLPENKIKNIFSSKKNIPYKKLVSKAENPDTEMIRKDILRLKKVTTKSLALLAEKLNSVDFKTQFMPTGKLEHSRLRDSLIAFIIKHTKGKNYSDGYIRSISKMPIK